MTPKHRRRVTDKMRLDWLGNDIHAISTDFSQKTERWYIPYGHTWSKTLRQAIDEAMEAEREKK